MSASDPGREREDALAEAADAIRELREKGEAVNLVELAERFHIEVEDATRLMKAQLMLEVAMRAPAEAERGELPAPVVPDDFEVLEEVGRGGMGVVYRARQKSLDRTVALKIVRLAPPHDRILLERFRREAKSLAKLRHPHIVSIHGYGELEGNVWFSMDLIEGKTLGELVQEGAVTPSRACRLLQQVAGAIAYSHSHGLVHRDLKPGNVLVDEDDNAYVVDFGLAFELDADTGLTQTGQILGTPNYMAPEQARGGAKGVGEPTDVYALGALLYECLAGEPPFSGSSVLEIVQAVTSRDPTPPRKLRPEVPTDLEAICLKAMEKDPGSRYPTAAAFLDDLLRFEAGRDIRARRSGVGSRVRKLIRRNRAAVTAGVVTAILAVVALLVFVAPRLGETPTTLLGMAADFEAAGDHAAAERVYARLIENEGWLERAYEPEARDAHTGWLRSTQAVALARARAGEGGAALQTARDALARYEGALGEGTARRVRARALFTIVDIAQQAGLAAEVNNVLGQLDALVSASGPLLDMKRDADLHARLRQVAFEEAHPARSVARNMLQIADVKGGSAPDKTDTGPPTHQVRTASFAYDPVKQETLLLWHRVLPLALDGRAVVSEYVEVPFARPEPALVDRGESRVAYGALGAVHRLHTPFHEGTSEIDGGLVKRDRVVIEYQQVYRLMDLSRFGYKGGLLLGRESGHNATHWPQYLDYSMTPIAMGDLDADLRPAYLGSMPVLMVIHLARLEPVGDGEPRLTLESWTSEVEELCRNDQAWDRGWGQDDEKMNISWTRARRQEQSLAYLMYLRPATEIGPAATAWLKKSWLKAKAEVAAIIAGLKKPRVRDLHIQANHYTWREHVPLLIHIWRSSVGESQRAYAKRMLDSMLGVRAIMKRPGSWGSIERWYYLHALRAQLVKEGVDATWLEVESPEPKTPVGVWLVVAWTVIVIVWTARVLLGRRMVSRVRIAAQLLLLSLPLTMFGVYWNGYWWPSEWAGLLGGIVATLMLSSAAKGNMRRVSTVGFVLLAFIPLLSWVLELPGGTVLGGNIGRDLAAVLAIGGLPFLAVALIGQLGDLTRPTGGRAPRGPEARAAWKRRRRFETRSLLMGSAFFAVMFIAYVQEPGRYMSRWFGPGGYPPNIRAPAAIWWWVVAIGAALSLLLVLYAAYRRTGLGLRGPEATVAT